MSEFELSLRITLIKPPAHVRFAVQRGKADLFKPTISTGADLSFVITIRGTGDPAKGPPRFLGEFTQGPPASRFLYVNSGKRAGDSNGVWDRRAKIPLGGITWALIDKSRLNSTSGLEVRIFGTGKDGGPTCGGVKLAADSWRVCKMSQ